MAKMLLNERIKKGLEKPVNGQVDQDEQGYFRWIMSNKVGWRKKRPRICRGCGKPFMPTTFLDKYGSPACKALGWKHDSTASKIYDKSYFGHPIQDHKDVGTG